MTSTTEERVRDLLAGVASDAAVDPMVGRPAAVHALKHHTRRRAQRALGGAAIAVLALVVATVALIGNPAGDGIHTVASTRAPAPAQLPHALEVRQQLVGVWAPQPIAFDGREVWLLHEGAPVGSRISVVVERRAAASGALVGRVVVPQEAATVIAAADGFVWIAGGGDGGVPDFAVSRIDVASGRVAFTRRVGNACECALAAGAGTAWLAGAQTRDVLRLDPQTGAVAATIALPGRLDSLAVVAGKVLVGLDDSRVVVIDPATNTIERTITVAAPGQAAAGAIVGITPAGSTGASWVTRSDGQAFELVDNARLEPRPVAFLARVVFSGAALRGDELWAVGVDDVLASSIDGRTRGYANYDPSEHTFGPVVVRNRRFAFDAQPSSTRLVVAAGPMLWFLTADRIFVVAPS